VSHGFLYNIVVSARSACDLMGVLTDPGSRRCHGIFCTCRGVASRILLTGELMLHRARRGGAPPEQDSTALGMVPQRLGWWHKAGDDRTRPEVTEGTCPAYLASRHRHGRALGRRSYAPRGCCRPFSRGAAWRKDGSR
jgi:hypothetical protein